MSTKSTKLSDNEVIIQQCAACRDFVGFSNRRVTVFCQDIFCLVTREWVWETERETDLLVWLHEVEGLSIAEAAEALDIERYRAHGLYQTHREKKLRARM